MKYLLLVFLLAFLSLAAKVAPLTPGEMHPLCSVEDVCTTNSYALSTSKVTNEERNAVFAAYKIPNLQRHLYEIRHLIPRETCGSDGAKNLFPMKYELEAKKNEVDNIARAKLCAKKLTLKEIPKQFTGDWGQK